jgi:hypothetical protein
VAKDVIGNELYDTDIVQVNMTETKCIGVIKGVHRKRRGGFVRVVAHFDIPFEDGDALLAGVLKVANPDHHKRLYGTTQGEPVKAIRDLQRATYDHEFESETVNKVQR